MKSIGNIIIAIAIFSLIMITISLYSAIIQLILQVPFEILPIAQEIKMDKYTFGQCKRCTRTTALKNEVCQNCQRNETFYDFLSDFMKEGQKNGNKDQK